MIYIVTTFTSGVVNRKDIFDESGDIRAVGWFSSYNEARNRIINNSCDIFEGIYDYAVLESMPEGMYPETKSGYKAQYFRFNREQSGYEPVDEDEVIKPEFKQMVWSLG